MRKIILLLCMCVSFASLYAQENLLANDLEKYQVAFKYLLKLKKYRKSYKRKLLKVSCNITDLNRNGFNLNELGTMPEIRKILQSNKVRFRDFKPDVYSPELALFTPDVDNPDYVLFFSPIEDEMLVVSIVPRVPVKRQGSWDINKWDDMASFNKSWDFLFIFNEQGKLLKVLRTMWEYD